MYIYIYSGFPLVGGDWGDPPHYPKNWLVHPPPPMSPPHCFDPKPPIL